MHHVALNGARSNDGDFDHQIVKIMWFQPRQHGHLGAGFHLKNPHTVAALEHGVGVRIFRWNLLNGQRFGIWPIEIYQRQCFADGRQHTQC